ncbi:MAG: hypothetical protein NVS2B12_09670 [Ktedonobacteraceae bacterium]
MLSEQLLARVQALLQNGQLTISNATLPQARVASLLATVYGGNAIVIDGAQIEPADQNTTVLVVSGQAPILNVEHVPVQVTFHESDDGLDCSLKYRLPATWTFAQSFPELPVAWDPRVPLGAPQYTILNDLVCTAACFIVTSAPYTDSEYGVSCDVGLNFAGHSRLNGLLGNVELLLKVQEPLVLAGPIVLPASVPMPIVPQILPWPPTRQSRPLPGINLKANLNAGLDLGEFKLTDVYLRVHTPLTKDLYSSYPFLTPAFYLGGDLHISEQRTVEVVARKLFGVNSVLAFSAFINEEVHVPSLNDLARFVGAKELESQLNATGTVTPFFSSSVALNIEALFFTFSFAPLALNTVALTVGLKQVEWQALDGQITVHNLSVRFEVDDPLGAQRAMSVQVIGDMSIETVPLTATALAPNFALGAWLNEPRSLPLKTLLQRYLPDLPEVSDLTIDQFALMAQPGQSFNITATMADQPHPWVIDVGMTPLTISSAYLQLGYDKGRGVSGMLGGTIGIAGVSLPIAYTIPGSLTLRGLLPPVSLKSLVTHLSGDSAVWPASLDIEISSARILIQKAATDLEFLLGVQVDHLGSLIVKIARASGVWGFALGIDLDTQWRLSNISSALAPFDSSFTFSKALLLFSSVQSIDFMLPDMAVFNDPLLSTVRPVQPANLTGVIKGFNFFAELALEGNKNLELLQKTLHLDRAVLDIVLQIGEDPANVLLTAGVSGRFNDVSTFQGVLRVRLSEGQPSIGLLGDAHIIVHDHPLLFTGELAINELGAFFAATLQGNWTDAFDVSGLTLSDIAVEVGTDWEGIPTLGVAATLTIGGKQGSVAVLFNSQNPVQSLLAGSMSDLTLADIAALFLNATTPIAPEVASILAETALKGVPFCTLPLNLIGDLDKAQLSVAVIQAFAQNGRLQLAEKQALLVVGKPGSIWYLTDYQTLSHYSIIKQDSQLQVLLQVQLAIVPQATMIGQLSYQQGITFAAQAQFLELDASLTVEVHVTSGIAVDGSMQALHVANVFSLTGASNQGDPVISLATYDAATSKFRGPHCIVSGGVALLGTSANLDLRVTLDQISFLLDAKIFDVFQASVNAQCPLKNFKHGEFAISATMSNDLFAFLQTKGSAAIQQSAADATQAIASAQSAVEQKQQQVNAINGQIAQQRAVVQQERQNAQATLAQKQNDVNTLQNNINHNQQRINQLNSEISSLEQDIRDHPWNVFSSESTDIIAKQSEVGGLETANGGLRGSLVVATQALIAFQATVVVTPIELDPRVSSLYAELNGANLALQTAQALLVSVVQSYGRIANVATWVAQHGSDNLLIVTHAAFAGQLSQLSGGSVSMGIDGALMARPFHIDQSFNFHDLDNVVKIFVEQLKQLI